MRWQPIETAPKNGQHVLLANSDHCEVGYWRTFESGRSEWSDLDEKGWLTPDWATHWVSLNEALPA